ncbi:MAG: hypothetical protein ACRDRX_21540 [Pseudonocardiaceae bacterium]
MDDLARQFAQMQNYAAALHSLITDAQAQAPLHAEGSDRSRAVHVVLGPDGLPTTFRVEADWKRRIEPAAFGAAVLEAFQAAVGDRLSAWTRTLEDDGWKTRADRLTSGADDPAAAPSRDRVPPAVHRPVSASRSRPIGDLTEDVIKAFDTVRTVAAQPPQPVVGSGRGGTVTITLSSTGLTSCSADPGWVREQTAAQLMNALSTALAAAKEDLANRPPGSGPEKGLDGLLSEAMAVLNDPRRLVN